MVHLGKKTRNRIGVIGDLMLDSYIIGESSRLSPEAPVPVLLHAETQHRPGGAANVAVNIASLGCTPDLVGVVGQDAAADALRRALRESGVRDNYVTSRKKIQTIQKTRVISAGHHIVRIDSESTVAIPKDLEDVLMSVIARHIQKWSAVVLSDYAKGLFTDRLAKEVIRLARKDHVPVIVDPKPMNARKFLNATVFTPNHREAAEVAGVESIRKAGRYIQSLLRGAVLITQGGDGMTLFEGKQERHFPALRKEVIDITGAGDTVVAALAVALSNGESLQNAASYANRAAGVVVGKFGTSAVSKLELKNVA